MAMTPWFWLPTVCAEAIGCRPAMWPFRRERAPSMPWPETAEPLPAAPTQHEGRPPHRDPPVDGSCIVELRGLEPLTPSMPWPEMAEPLPAAPTQHEGRPPH